MKFLSALILSVVHSVALIAAEGDTTHNWLAYPGHINTYQTAIEPVALDNRAAFLKLLRENNKVTITTFVEELPKSQYGWNFELKNAGSISAIYLNETQFYPKPGNVGWKYAIDLNLALPNNLVQTQNRITVHLTGSPALPSLTNPYYYFSNHSRIQANEFKPSLEFPVETMMAGIAAFLTIIFLVIFIKSLKEIYWLHISGVFLVFFFYMLLQTTFVQYLTDYCFLYLKLKWGSLAWFALLTHVFINKFFNVKMKLPEILLLASCIPWTLSLLVLPDHIFYYMLTPMVPFSVALITLLGQRLKAQLQAKRLGAKRLSVGYLVLLISLLHDFFLPLEPLRLHPYGVLVFAGNILMILVDIYLSQTTRVSELNKTLHQQKLAFSRFLPSHFLESLNKSSITELKLGDQKERDMTIMFVDIRDFTKLSEGMTPEENFNFLNSYLKRMVPIIQAHGGFIDKFIGDAIMALFPDKPEKAIDAALDMSDKLREYNNHRNSMNYKSIEIGIGIHTGKIILGTIGQEDRMDTTVISDTVNLCQRIESLTKDYRTPILISEQMLISIDDPSSYPMRIIDRVKVKGKEKSVSIFEVFNADDPTRIESRSIFEHGVYLFLKSNYEAARLKFLEVLKLDPLDTAAAIYLKRSNESLTFSWDIENTLVKGEDSCNELSKSAG